MKKILTRNPWLLTYANENAPIRMFCFPYAGGAATIFRNWGDYIPENIEVCAVQLPGRGSRMREKAHTSINDLLPALREGLGESLNEKPAIFYGHSMGALIAFEFARMVVDDIRLLHLFVSGHRAPHVPSTRRLLYQLPEDEFIEEIRDLGGMQQQILDNQELMNLLVPIIRADFTLCDTYQYQEQQALNTNITVLGGLNDPRTTKDQLAAWEDLTTGSFQLHILPGEHFFIHTHEMMFFDILTRELYHLI